MYDIIFNALTSEALKKFLRFAGNTDIKKSLQKKELIEKIKKGIEDDKTFHQSFVDFYRRIEKAGRKDFWFAEMRAVLTSAELNDIRNKINKIEKEDDKIYIPQNEGDRKYFNISSSNDLLELKIVRKKIIRELDASKNILDVDYDYVAYKKTPIRHVSYVKFDLNKGRIVYGSRCLANTKNHRKIQTN